MEDNVFWRAEILLQLASNEILLIANVHRELQMVIVV